MSRQLNTVRLNRHHGARNTRQILSARGLAPSHDRAAAHDLRSRRERQRLVARCAAPGRNRRPAVQLRRERRAAESRRPRRRPATDPTLRSIVQRAPGERIAAALIAGRETVIVVGKRDALRGPLAASVRVEVPDTLVWTLVVAHEMTFEPLRIALWVLSLLTVALLGFGLIRERRQTIRVAESIGGARATLQRSRAREHGEERVPRQHLARAAHAAQRDRRLRRAAQGRRLRRPVTAPGAARRSHRRVGDPSPASRRSGARHRQDRGGAPRGARRDDRAASVRAQRRQRARVARQRARTELLDRRRRVAAARCARIRRTCVRFSSTSSATR